MLWRMMVAMSTAALGAVTVPVRLAASEPLVLNDSLGRTISVAPHEVDSSLHPPGTLKMERQLPTATKGVPQAEAVRQRIATSKSGQESLLWFPATPPMLAPYLGTLDEFGNTAVQPGGLFLTSPLSRWAQAGKYWLSDIGLRESFYQSVTLVGMSETLSGERSLQYYAVTFLGKWAVVEAPNGGPAGWLSTEVDVQLGLSSASQTQSPQSNLGTLVNPQGNVYGPNGAWMSELAWQQSLMGGRLVLLGGVVDQSNALDANAYANNSQGQFLNSAFVNSSVLPLPGNNLGLNLQWQPGSSWYALLGTGANNQTPGQSPFHRLGFDDWSHLMEVGLTPANALGMGPGVYRLQPFLATVEGRTQAGVGLNVQQQLGTESSFAAFGRFGVGGAGVALSGVRAQASAGLVMGAPLQNAGWVPRLSNDLLGIGFVWSQASASMGRMPIYHENEYALETFYSLQITPTLKLQPDLQVVWNSAFNPNGGAVWVWQLQINAAW